MPLENISTGRSSDFIDGYRRAIEDVYSEVRMVPYWHDGSFGDFDPSEGESSRDTVLETIKWLHPDFKTPITPNPRPRRTRGTHS